MSTHLSPVGPRDADIMIIGQTPGADEFRYNRPFQGHGGTELETMLANVGISRDECYLTYVSKRRAPRNNNENLFLNYKKRQPTVQLEADLANLQQEIEDVRPSIIISLGELPLWALTGETGITKWRGSQLSYPLLDGTSAHLLPTYSPGQILRMWPWKAITQNDFRRMSRYKEWRSPEYDFILRPNFQQVYDFCADLHRQAEQQPIIVSGDVETRAGHIACFGIGTSAVRALCVPLMDINKADSAYWMEAEEISVVKCFVELFRNPRILWVLQNGTFDDQYFARHWGAIPHLATDTMLEHHVAWAGDLPKGLDFLSSMYCENHVYWKEDSKFWDPRHTPEEQLWEYNCKDCVKTLEIAHVLASQTKHLGMEEQVDFQTQKQFKAVFKMMMRGVRCDRSRKGEFSSELAKAEERMRRRLNAIVGDELNIKSPKQVAHFFYDILGLPVQRNRKTKRPSTDEKSLKALKRKACWITPIVDLILLMRSTGVFKSTFVDMELDVDGRIRCSYNIAGTETFRYSSSENAFRSGGNLQNIPKGNEAQGLPNVKDLFIPDEGYVWAEHDLAQADAQVVAWEANDDKLKYIFRNGIDLHLANASDIYGLNIPIDELADPDGIDFYKKKFGLERQRAKGGVHAVDYAATAYTLGIALGISTRDAQKFIDLWFSEHPGIRDWQDRVQMQIMETREVKNAFGFRRYYFDRIEGLLPEALAWIPQSTVALAIDKGLVNIDENVPSVHPLLQVHDSLCVQYPIATLQEDLFAVKEAMHVVIPYDDPLIIPVGVELAASRWGAKKEMPWDLKGQVVDW